jgi:hypothetical protein
MDEDIKKILEAGIQAPSGENCQPWKIELVGNVISLYNDPTKDRSIYNFQQKGSLVSCGAFIENVRVAAESLGYIPQIEFFDGQDNLVAKINLEKGEIKPNNSTSIFKRATNRKLYSPVQISADQKSALLGSSFGPAEVSLTEDKKVIKELSDPISLNEQLIFENKHIHDFFYDHVRWNEAEDKKEKNGFYIKTLELSLPQKLAFNILKSWKWVERAKKIKISKQIAKDNAKNYASASILGIITIPTNGPLDYVKAGISMQRLWLNVTEMGLSLQPMTGVLFFMQKIMAGETEEFSSEEVNAIKNAFDKIKRGFSTDKTIAMLFRIGNGGEPSARSSRYSIADLLVK